MRVRTLAIAHANSSTHRAARKCLSNITRVVARRGEGETRRNDDNDDDDDDDDDG